MATNPHTKRDSLTGFNRKQLRQTVRQQMGVKSNADMFEGCGFSWHTTEAQERRERIHKQLLEHHLRTSDTFEGNKLSREQSNKLKAHLVARLADAGPPQPVKVDKQQLAKERKKLKPARKLGETNFVKLAQRVTKERNLEREIQNKRKMRTPTSKEVQGYGHYTVIKGPLTDKEKQELGL
jgi:hypothetical protein